MALLKVVIYIPLTIKLKISPGTHFYDVEVTKADANFISSDANATFYSNADSDAILLLIVIQ